jgi:hypothetical protein
VWVAAPFPGPHRLNSNKSPTTDFQLARHSNSTQPTVSCQDHHSPPSVKFILQKIKMDDVNPTPLVNNCCGYCCKAEEYGNHENCGWCDTTDVCISLHCPPYPNVLGTAAPSKSSPQDILTPQSFSVSEMTANFKFTVLSIRYPRASESC